MNPETALKRSVERRVHVVHQFAHRLAQHRSVEIPITPTNRSGLTNGEVIESRFLHILFITILYL